MHLNKVILRINSTFYDFFGEYLMFVREVFPELKQYCLKQGIDLVYDDVAFSVPEDKFNRQIILQDLRCLDTDRTIFICFRGQRFGWRPSPDDINHLTLDEYPELVDYIGNLSITELAIMHALKPFDKCIDGKITELAPVKHALFYFRKPGYLEEINNSQKIHYINKSNGMDKSVLDMEIAKAKDLIYEIKKEFDDNEDFNHYVEITEYDAKWDENLNLEMLMLEYTNEMEKIKQSSLDYFVNIHREYLCDEKQGGLGNFTHGDESLKEVMRNDIIKALKIEFPENFND